MGKSNLQNIEAGMMKRRSSERQQENMATAPFGQLSQEAKDAMLIPVAQIVQSPFQSRAKMDEEHIESLLDTIGRDGLLSPIVVRRLDEHGVAKLKDRLAEGVSVTDTP